MNKDESLDPLLKRTSRVRPSAPPAGSCLDAETLAALTDGGLTPDQRAAAEAHAAECDRCLSVLAAMVKSEPPVGQTTHARWFSMRWLVPVTTAAVAIIAWILVRGPQTSVVLAPPAAPVETAASAERGQPQPEADSAAQARVRESSESRKTDQRPASRTDAREEALPRSGAKSTSKDSAATGQSAAKVEAPQTLADTAAATPSPPRPVAEAVPPPPAARGLPSVPSEPSSQRATDPSQERADGRFVSTARQVILPPFTIVSPDSNVLWRVSGIVIERSSDAGRTWREQLRLGTPAVLAGSSPSATVCWLVGRSGLVFHSTDGETWLRVEFPDTSVDLIRVTARDARNATVTTVSGRSFTTVDGGATWTSQENPAAPF